MPNSKRATPETRTQRVYDRLWAKANPYLGAQGKPSPYFKVVRGEATKGHSAYVGDGPNYERAAYLSGKLARQMGRKTKDSDPRGVAQRERKARRNAKHTVLHEWAHIYQDVPIYSNYEDREGAADKFANRVSKQLGFRRRGGSTYASARKNYVKKYGPQHWKREQFGSNYGKDPRTIKQYGMPSFSNPYW